MAGIVVSDAGSPHVLRYPRVASRISESCRHPRFATNTFRPAERSGNLVFVRNHGSSILLLPERDQREDAAPPKIFVL